MKNFSDLLVLSRPLTPRQHELLQLLWLRRGAFVTMDNAMDWLYGDNPDPPYDSVIPNMLHVLRKRLPAAAVLRNYHGRGWSLEIAP